MERKKKTFIPSDFGPVATARIRFMNMFSVAASTAGRRWVKRFENQVPQSWSIPHQEIIDNVKLKHRGGTVIGEARYVRYSKDHIRSDASVAYCLLMADQQNIHHWRFSRHLEHGSQTATFHLNFDLAFPPSYIFPGGPIFSSIIQSETSEASISLHTRVSKKYLLPPQQLYEWDARYHNGGHLIGIIYRGD